MTAPRSIAYCLPHGMTTPRSIAYWSIPLAAFVVAAIVTASLRMDTSDPPPAHAARDTHPSLSAARLAAVPELPAPLATPRPDRQRSRPATPAATPAPAPAAPAAASTPVPAVTAVPPAQATPAPPVQAAPPPPRPTPVPTPAPTFDDSGSGPVFDDSGANP
jgi:hypothetical protein